MCKSLIPMFRGDQKLDLFRLWLEKGRDFSRCAVEVERKNLQSSTAKSKDLCLSRAQLEASGKYSKDDIDELVRRKTANGAYIDDPNFPGREDLRQYIINSETSAEVARTREDSQRVSSTAELDGAEALALTEDGCDFASNTGPNIRSLMGELGGAAGDPPAGPAPKAKGTRKGKGKGKGQGRAGRGDGGDGDNAETEPDKLPTPLAKATSLKAKVLPVFLARSDQNPDGLLSIRGLHGYQTLATNHYKYTSCTYYVCNQGDSCLITAQVFFLASIWAPTKEIKH